MADEKPKRTENLVADKIVEGMVISMLQVLGFQEKELRGFQTGLDFALGTLAHPEENGLILAQRALEGARRAAATLLEQLGQAGS